MKRMVVLVVGLMTALWGNAQEKDSVLDRINSAMTKAAIATGAVKEFGEPRRVSKGAKPEIVLQDDQLLFNGKRLQLGQRLAEWDKVLPGKRRCDDGERIHGCVWDSAGILVVMQNANPEKIASAKIYLRLPNEDEREPLQPYRPFSGYLELDGYGMDTSTQFWEVRRSTRQDRNIRCGLRECVAPHGALGKDTSIYFSLSKPNEYGTLTAIELGGGIL